MSGGAIAALYVERDGPYFGFGTVDPFDAERDARSYRGPHPVVAHPPCKRWGNYWHGSPSKPHEHLLGDDDGCFAHALWAVRTFGGVLEHPAGSRAWDWFGLYPPAWLGWGHVDRFGGRTIEVDQSDFGHMAPKKTWLYAVLPVFPRLAPVTPHAETKPVEKLSKLQRRLTPEPFRDVLLDLARGCRA